MIPHNEPPNYCPSTQAAKLDPHNPNVFLYIGHYQRLIKKDLKCVSFSYFMLLFLYQLTPAQPPRRAAKCYEKALELCPAHTEAAMLLGDMLYAVGDEAS